MNDTQKAPKLTITLVEENNLGRCYNEYVYSVVSLSPLSKSAILALRGAGFLGYGQDFWFDEILPDGSKSPVVEKPDWSRRQPAYTYRCVDRVDSGD